MRSAQVQQGPSRRAAFTLIELLVVLTIIAILVALSSAAIIRYIEVQKKSNTQTVLNKLTPILKVQWNALTEQANREPIPSGVLNWIQTNIEPNDSKRQRAVYVKLRQRQVFPMTFGEALNPAPLPPQPKYQQTLAALGIAGSLGLAYESSACLLMALQAGIAGGGFQPEELGISATQNFPAGTGQIPVLVDAWNTPLAFFRWPSGSPDLNPPGGGVGQPGYNNDPSDPDGTFTIATWQSNATFYANFLATFGYAPPVRVAGTPATSFRLVPIIVSAGPDTNLALDATAAPSPLGNTLANDNLSSAAQ